MEETKGREKDKLECLMSDMEADQGPRKHLIQAYRMTVLLNFRVMHLT